eukprot:g3817.t1
MSEAKQQDAGAAPAGTTTTTTAPTRTLGSGSAALTVSELGFGCMGITAFYGNPIPDEDAMALLVHAYESGCTHWDTAEVYQGKLADGSTVFNETVVGKAVAAIGKRDEIVLATKYMPKLHDGGNTMTPEMAVEACRASCERLGVECVDLYYVHRFADKVPVEDQAKAMLAVQAAGLAKHVGVSEFSPRNLRAFHAICPVTCVQQEWSLMNRDLEEDLVPTCRELGIGVVAYSPLCRKLLTGELEKPADLGDGDLRASRYGRFSEDVLEENAKLAKRVAALAAERGLTAAQLSLAWVQSQGLDVTAIPGTTKIKHLDDNAAVRGIPMLTEEEQALVAAAVPAEDVKGTRFAGGDKIGTYKANM